MICHLPAKPHPLPSCPVQREVSPCLYVASTPVNWASLNPCRPPGGSTSQKGVPQG